jgi:hypothetical protein
MKQIDSRQFQKAFGKLTGALKPGQSLLITHHGKPLGAFTKTPARKIKTPNFLKNLEATGLDPAVGQSILDRFYDDAVS